MKRVAYYKGCLASLSAKELDSSTQALAPKVGIELLDLETVTCCGAGDIHGKRVLLVDDVVTTGATLSACTDTLAQAGARRVSALAFARDL